MNRTGEGATDPSAFGADRKPTGRFVGPLFGVSAAIFYTLANIALRGSTAVDPFLVSAVKAAPTVLFLLPLVGWMGWSGRVIASDWRPLLPFVAAALVGQIVGNTGFQIALGRIGLAASVPITLGVMIATGGLFGRWLLGEPVRPRTVVAMVVLIVAVVILSRSHAAPPDTTAPPGTKAITGRKAPPGTKATPGRKAVADTTGGSVSAMGTVLGALCAAASGAAYALFGAMVRRTLNTGLSAPATMLASGLVGTIALWAITWTRLDAASLASVTSPQWSVMALAGLFNFVAFVSLSLSLKVLPVVAVNLINASQVAMAAVAGVLLFAEPITGTLVVGIGLTLAGLAILATRAPRGAVLGGTSRGVLKPDGKISKMVRPRDRNR